MKKRLAVVLAVFWLAGCRESNSDLRIEQKSVDSVRGSAVNTANTTPKVIKDVGSNVKIVTGEPATVPDKQEENAEPLKDKPGAVAVKMEY